MEQNLKDPASLSVEKQHCLVICLRNNDTTLCKKRQTHEPSKARMSLRPILKLLVWALFVLGHDCGHGSFSNDPRLNSVAGHLLHSSILVPYHSWRISQRTHHQNHGHVENDESWHPLPESLYKNLEKTTQIFRFTLPFPMLAFPFYLWGRSPWKNGSHFDPDSNLFLPKEKKDVVTSTACWTAVAALLVCLNFVMGPIQMLKLYVIPY